MKILTTTGAAACAAALLTMSTGGALASSVSGASTSASDVPREARVAFAQLRESLAPLRTPAAAVAAGYLPTDECTELPGTGGMGYHYVNPAYLGTVDPSHPAILVFVPTATGGRTLGAAEWFHPDADQDLSTAEDRPSLYGVPFDGPMLGHEPGMPIHDDLHVWLFDHNPLGLTSPWNPRVSCPA